MTIAPHPIQHHPGDFQPRIEGAIAVDDGSHGTGQARTIDNQEDGEIEQAGDVGGTAGVVATGCTVKQTHHPLDDGTFRPAIVGGKAGTDVILACQYRIEIAAGSTRDVLMKHGIDVVGTDFERLDGFSPTAQGRE